ncbi:MAG: methyl-accepting chemotaxis protein [Pseudomonadota bacterium]
MSEKSLSERLLPLFGIALVASLAVAAASHFLGVQEEEGGSRMAAAVQQQGVLSQQLIAVAGAARRHETEAFDSLGTLLNGVRATQPLPNEASAVAEARDKVARHASAVLETRSALEEVSAAATQIDAQVDQLFEQLGDLLGMLPSAERAALAPHIERFELTAKGMQQDAAALNGGFGTIALVVERMSSGEEYLGQMIRGLSEKNNALGVPDVSSGTTRAQLARVSSTFNELSGAVRIAVGAADRLIFMQSRADLLTAASEQWFKALPAVTGTTVASGLSSLLMPIALGVGLVLALVMLVLQRGAASAQRLAKAQAAQNERNQTAILRLLDELGSLADGDLTVQATVTEDITGAIADSINYAVEALRGLVETIDASAIQIDAAARQTKASAAHLATASGNQSRHVASATESIANIAKQIEEVSGNAERSSDVARHSVDVAHKGGEAVRRTIDGMNTIRETIQETSKRIKRLGESSQEIGNIVELINDIADQTNILALNASIQASMAGEAGRGFAVVADEVQRLAEKSANATKQIEVLVRTIQADTNEAVISMEQSTTDVVSGATLAENAGASLDEIEQVSNQIASLVQNISATARQQATAAGGVTRNMAVLQEISAQTAESTGATSTAIGKLAKLASGLRKSVAGFTLPDRASGSSGPSTTTGAIDISGAAEDDSARASSNASAQRTAGAA